MISTTTLPVAVIGAGPVGLAAAAGLMERGIEAMILEAAPRVGANILDWGHVRMFTPWSYLIDPACQRLLEAIGNWTLPNENTVPYGEQLVEEYLNPIANLDPIAQSLHLNHRVVSVSREGHDRMMDGKRGDAPFLLVVDTPDGRRRFRARAVIDASGTWNSPNPLGAGGIEADGELRQRQYIRYGMPDVLGAERQRYAGKRTLVVGSGHSAVGTVLALATLAGQAEGTSVAWAVRRTDPTRLWGGGESDEIRERGALGTRVHEVVHSGAVELFMGLSIGTLRDHPDGLEVVDVQNNPQTIVDEIVVSTGARPNLQMLGELRLDLDIPTESSKALGPLIDPNYHSCGSVPPHGAEELRHPEQDFFMVGMKSYGRAPTFLLRTGYEQARSVVAALAGDMDAARRLELVLPETGVCSTDAAYSDRPSGVMSVEAVTIGRAIAEGFAANEA